MVEGAGFEPAKASPADLQSAPFNNSGTPPYRMCDAGNGEAFANLKPLVYLNFQPLIAYFSTGAGDGTRTRNLLITSQLLCQLSYAGADTSIIISDNRDAVNHFSAGKYSNNNSGTGYLSY